MYFLLRKYWFAILYKTFPVTRKADMRSFFCIGLLVFSAASIMAQQPASHHEKSAAAMPPKPEFSTRLPTEETVNAFLQQMFGYDSSLSWKVADIRPSDAAGLAKVTVVISSPQGQQLSILYVTSDGQHVLTGELIPFGTRPFDADRKQLEKGITGPSRGPADAAATIVEFSDLQCPHCKEVQPILEKLLAEEPNVRLVFQNFPLAIPTHDWAARGAAYADCVGRAANDAFWKFIHDVYEAQTTITAANADEKLTALADQAGVKGADMATCAALPETTARVQESVALGKEVKITGTPSLFVGGRKIENLSGLPYDVFKKLVDFAVKDAGDRQTVAK
jgi:protein-disulfide isomerase